MFAKYADKEVLNCLTWSDLRRMKAIFTPYRKPFAPPRNYYSIGLLVTQKNGCGGAISVTERSCAAPISKVESPGADLGGGCRGCAPPPPPLPWDDLRFSDITGILQKKTMWFIGVEVEQETSAPPPKNNPGSAPESHIGQVFTLFRVAFRGALDWLILGIVAWIVGWRQRSHWLTSLW